MNDCMCGDFFGEKPHRDEALAESRWGLNSYNKNIIQGGLRNGIIWFG